MDIKSADGDLNFRTDSSFKQAKIRKPMILVEVLAEAGNVEGWRHEGSLKRKISRKQPRLAMLGRWLPLTLFSVRGSGLKVLTMPNSRQQLAVLVFTRINRTSKRLWEVGGPADRYKA